MFKFPEDLYTDVYETKIVYKLGELEIIFLMNMKLDKIL